MHAGESILNGDYIVYLDNKPVTFLQLMRLCEDSASNKMIYEAWLDSALINAYIAARALNKENGDRFIAYFKHYHNIDDESTLANEAHDSIDDARQALYGD